MKLINDIYLPDILLLCIGGNYTMDAIGAAYAINNFFNSSKIVIPMHYGRPIKNTDPKILEENIKCDCKMNVLIPGISITL